jgi:3,4-dihydroxy 2-butanone 4-phosphate synthase/GTP cyclohydrolase II
MVANNESSFETAFTISVDYKFGVTTGISTHERALTLRSLANPLHGAEDFKRPGHIFPLIGKEGGVRTRPGHTEAAIDLCKLAELEPVGVICEILGDDGECLRLKDLLIFSKKFNLKMITIADLIDYQNEGNNSFLDKGENYATH